MSSRLSSVNSHFKWSRKCNAGGATIAPATGLTPSFDTLPDLPATQVVQLLCSRQITAVDYVEALYDRYESGGYECLNPFITYNISQVINTRACSASTLATRFAQAMQGHAS